MSENVTLGEVHRLCLDIKRAVEAQNGRVRKLEDDAIRIKTIWTFGAVLIALAGDWIKQKVGL